MKKTTFKQIGKAEKQSYNNFPHPALWPLSPAPERQPPKCLASKTNRACTPESHSLWWTETAIKGLTGPRAQRKSSPLKTTQTWCERGSLANFKPSDRRRGDTLWGRRLVDASFALPVCLVKAGGCHLFSPFLFFGRCYLCSPHLHPSSWRAPS